MAKEPLRMAKTETKIERLSDEDAAYLATLIKQSETVQAKIAGFSEYLTQKHTLAQGDKVDPTGVITRA